MDGRQRHSKLLQRSVAFALAAQLGCASVDGAAPHAPGMDAKAAETAMAPDTPAALPCNGDARNCPRTLNNIVFPTAHNAMSSAADGWFLPNQPHGIRAQLDAGITGLMIDVHPAQGLDGIADGTPLLCHGYCQAGKRDLVEAFSDIRAWLLEHPRTVLVFVIEDHVAPEGIEAALVQSKLRALCIEHAIGTPWPKMAELIAQGRRVLIMLESGKGQQPWNHAYAKAAFDTPYAAEKPEDFSCDVLRGTKGNAFFVVNHFLTKGLTGHAELAKQVNFDPLLAARVDACEKQQSQRANLIAVDWYTLGDVLALAAAKNAAPQTGDP